MERDFQIVTIAPGRLLLKGEFDLGVADELGQALVNCDEAEVVVDLSGVTFIDSTGVASMLRARREHPTVRFVRPTENVLRLLDMTGTAEHLLDLDG